ncbi:MAG: 30S ribosomal protein S9, partial [Bacteroidota bacterium]|nr:30S ribosomal protein S9 [Bacteroidota bacterium]
MEVIHTIGRRKTAVARVYMSEGKGEITINNKALDSYFPTATHQYKVNQPFTLTDTLGKYNLNVSVTGGGPT